MPIQICFQVFLLHALVARKVWLARKVLRNMDANNHPRLHLKVGYESTIHGYLVLAYMKTIEINQMQVCSPTSTFTLTIIYV